MKEKAIQRFVYCYEQILIRTLSWGAQFQYKGIPVHIFALKNIYYTCMLGAEKYI